MLATGPDASSPVVVLTHGAGAFMDTPFMDAFAAGFARAGLKTLRFEFPYMQRRRQSGKKGPPDRQAVLIEYWRKVIATLGDPGNLVIGGKSMGGRIASMVAEDVGVRGLICLGYPFHPPGKPENPRISHLEDLRTPTLILQGSRDPFGGREEIPSYRLSESIAVVYLEDGDHSFKPRKSSGLTVEQNWDRAVEEAVRFARSL
jgi:predicted alpha/beta-hydrolase family hydrolase